MGTAESCILKRWEYYGGVVRAFLSAMANNHTEGVMRQTEHGRFTEQIDQGASNYQAMNRRRTEQQIGIAANIQGKGVAFKTKSLSGPAILLS